MAKILDKLNFAIFLWELTRKNHHYAQPCITLLAVVILLFYSEGIFRQNYSSLINVLCYNIKINITILQMTRVLDEQGSSIVVTGMTLVFSEGVSHLNIHK